MRKILLLIAVMLFITSSVIAQKPSSEINQTRAAISSTGTGGSWNTTSTWAGGVVPTNADDVTILDGDTVNVINGTGVAESITVASGGTLRIYQTLTVDAASSNAGDLKVQVGGTLVLSAGNFTNSGAITIAKGVYMSMADATTLTNSGTINITSDSNQFGALKLNGTYTKSGSVSVTYGRYVIGVSFGDYWDLIGAPTSGTDAADFIGANGDLAENSGDYGIGPYNNDLHTWTTWSNANAISNGDLTSGKGYQMATTGAGGVMEFTGDIKAGSVNIAIINNDAANSGAGSRWNLVANPYPSYINANSGAGTNNVMDANDDGGGNVFDTSHAAYTALYAHDGDGTYTAINNSTAATYISPGQGFMVAAESTSNANFSFTANMQTTSGTDDFISGDAMDPDDRAELFIGLSQNNIDRHTEIYFLDQVTNGLDPSYDAGTFEFENNTIFSRLVSDDLGYDMAIQALPYSEMWDKVIPIGINAMAGEEMTVSVTHKTTPADLKIYLEDAQEGTFTLINNEDFVLTPTSDLSGVGRFFIHTTENALSNEEVNTSLLNAYKGVDNNYITIEGLATQATSTEVSLFNILGTRVMDISLDNTTNTQTVSTNGLSTGIYVLKLVSGQDQLTKKLIIK